MDGSGIVHLGDGEAVRPDGLRAGWDRFRVVRLEAAASEELDPALEHAIYVISGAGEALVGSTEVDLGAGSALTLVRGTGATIEAGSGGLEVFVISVRA